jgi:hypothetical protein
MFPGTAPSAATRGGTSPGTVSWLRLAAVFIATLAVAPAVEPLRSPLVFTLPEVVKLGEQTSFMVSAPPRVKRLEFKVVPFTEVRKDSDSRAVTLAGSVLLADGKATVPLKVTANGEFHILVTSAEESVQLAVIAENGQVWFGEGTVGALLQSRLLKALETQTTPKSTKSLKEAFRIQYEALLKERAEQAKEPTTTKSTTTRAIAPADIAAGDTLFLKVNWQGPKPTDPADPATPAALTVFETFAVDGIKVQIRNAADNSLVAETYLIDGVCSFTAPTASFAPKITLVASFPGITASGGIQPAGGGIGTFDAEDTAGNTYSYEIPSPLDFLGKTAATAVAFTFDRSAARGGDNLAQMMAAFHCVADMVRELKKTIGQDKKPAFKVVFPEPGNVSFFGGDKKLHITGVRSYVWDVIGHEFGHMVQDDTSSINAQGGGHDGSNQYDLASNATTLNNKLLSNRLALNEGYGTWIGVAFTERSSRYANKFKWVGDLLYRDWDNMEANGPAYKGEDTELGLQALLWDLHDANGDAYAATGLRDVTALGMKALFTAFSNKNMDSIFDVWRHVFVPSGSMAELTKAAGIDATALRRALNGAVTFAEFGVAPNLQSPASGQKIDLNAASGPKVRWKQHATGNAAMDLKSFRIILYSSDLTTTLWTSAQFTAGTAPLAALGARTYEYELTAADLTAIKNITSGRSDASAVMAVLGTATLNPATGDYLSNSIEVLLQDFNRALVAVVDSSGSNTTTDPTNQRVVASKESLRRLVSTADATADPTKVPDIAAAVDFDSGVTILSQFADPDSVVPTLDRVDSSGSTRIDLGINAATNLLDNINLGGGIVGAFQDRAAILVFTDGQNNNGPAPVITAIVNATLKGYRVHYGFLSPLVPSPAPRSTPVTETGEEDTAADSSSWDAPIVAKANGGPPTTIEEAVLRSGGIYAQIGDALSQVAFIEQVYARGLTNVDGANDSGGLLVGQANTADQLTPESDIKSYTFSGQQGEHVSIRVETVNFQPNVTVFDRSGAIHAAGIAAPAASSITLDLPPLPYTGEYSVRIYAEDGRTGLFNIFIDVQNVIGILPAIETEGALVFNRQTGLFEQTVVVRNNTGGVVNSFQIDISGLPAGASVISATAGGTSVAVKQAIAAGQAIELVIEYFNPARTAFVPTLTISADATAGPPTFTTGTSAVGFLAADGSFVVEFSSVPGTTYYMQYSDDGGQAWHTVLPAIEARGTRVQWIDSGPPKTSAHPSQVQSRLYRVAIP